jgi:hypothetical protein
MTAFMDAVGVEVGWRKKNSGQRESNPPFDVLVVADQRH